jgi:DNA primase
MKYLLDRGLTEETIRTFHIGYAKNEWRDLFIYLSSKGYSPEEIEQAGMTIHALDNNGNTKGWYDRFRGRIMFPIRNVSGATVGYSGRILPAFVDPSVAQGKYVNTPETALYHKSKILFGYDTAKKKMAEQKSVVVVEGQMDLCMSYQAGVHNTVAVSGTAFTDEHIHIIKRFCDTVILSFDTDTAGQNALKKTALLCLLGGLDVYIVGDIGTKDPADLIQESPHAWISAIEKERHVVEVMVDIVMRNTNDTRLQGQKIVQEVLPFVRAIQSPIDRSYFVQLISQRSHIPESTLIEELQRTTIQKNDEIITKEDTATIPNKDRLLMEIIAFSKLSKLELDNRVLSLQIDFEQFPETIIEEMMFTLEKKVLGDKDKYMNDLIRSFKKEKHKEELVVLQQKMRVDGADREAILKEIYDHVKKGPEVIYGL